MGGKPKFKPTARLKPFNTNKQERATHAGITPEHWPAEIQFLTELSFTPAAQVLQQSLSRAPTDIVNSSNSPSNSSSPWAQVPASQIHAITPHIQITPIDDSSHPAFGQHGLFAAANLPPDSFILLYLGQVHSNALSDTDVTSDYDLSFDRELGLSIDASRMGNESRCANDYRGVKERPNAEFRDCYVQVPSEKRRDGVRWERRVGIFVLSAGKVGGKRARGIVKGEEILVSYGKGFWEGRGLLHAATKDMDCGKLAATALET